MKRRKFLKTVAITGAGFAYMPNIFGQNNTTAVSNVGEDLDLYAVLDLFAESENLEEFEKALNDEEQEINNLDLNGNGEVEYIKVDEIVEENTHLIILQVEIKENEFQDVATIEIEKKSDDDYSLQVIGAEELYGENYIIEPVTEASTTTTVVHVHTYPSVVVMYSPAYTPWISPWRWSVHPIWWRPFRPIARSRRKSVRRSRYRKTTRRRSTRGRSMNNSRRKTSNKKKQTNKKQTNKKQTTNKKTTTSKKKTTTSKKGTTSQQKKNSNATKKKR